MIAMQHYAASSAASWAKRESFALDLHQSWVHDMIRAQTPLNLWMGLCYDCYEYHVDSVGGSLDVNQRIGRIGSLYPNNL